MSFNEGNTIQPMICDVLDKGDWNYVPAEKLERKLSDVMIEPMVKAALIRLNPEIAAEPSRADEVIYKLRAMLIDVQAENLVSQNEAFRRKVFEENSYPFGEGNRMIPVKLFGTPMNGCMDKNEYVFTKELTYCVTDDNVSRFDIVMYINGFPVVVGETKTPVRSAVSWMDAAQDILAYQKVAAAMFVPNILCFGTEGKEYRYGSVGSPVTYWCPWNVVDDQSEGGERKTKKPMEEVKKSVMDMLVPDKLLDIMQFFTIFVTDKNYRKYKVVCRYQQYLASNQIVDRVIQGFPRKGLIHMFQGSGKSYVMLFAAYKLRMTPKLKNPSVVIVDDRLDLEEQITGIFNSADIPNLENIASKRDLIDYFTHDTRKIAITTIFRFNDVESVLSDSSNIIVFVDEAHRTQEGNLGEKMRLGLPNAFFFGLTGTPINRIDRNTYRTFGADEDKHRYMIKYGFPDSIRDGATLPLRFEPVMAELHVDKEAIDEEFETMTAHLTEAERSALASRVKLKAIMSNPDRIRKVCEHIVKHFKEKVEPNGYKAQVVVYNRECCLLYKEQLDKLMPTEASTVVIDTNDDKEDMFKAYKRSRDEEAKVLDRFRDPKDPLKFLIVTNKLLTGFDAPILQVQYLDKPMKDHNLLQAICRTNRTYDSGKTHGLIVDYVGIFNNVAKYISFDDGSVKQVISNIEEVKNQIPAILLKCLSYFMGVDRTLEGYEGLMAAQECIPTNEDKDEFGADYRVLNRAWDAVAPDPMLVPYRSDYKWLTKVYESVKPVDNSGAMIWAALGKKTLELVNNNVVVEDIHEDLEILTVDADMIDEYIKTHKDIDKTTITVEIDLVARIRKHSKDPKYVKLGQRLEQLKIEHERGLLDSISFLKRLLDLAREAAQAEQEVVPEEEQDKGKAALTQLFESVKNEKTPVIVERIVADIDDIVRQTRFQDWQKSTEGKNTIKKVLRKIVWFRYKIRDKEVFDKAYSYIEQYY